MIREQMLGVVGHLINIPNGMEILDNILLLGIHIESKKDENANITYCYVSN